MDRKKYESKKKHATASLISLYGSEQELPFETRNNDIEARLQKYSNGYEKVVDSMLKKNSAAHLHSPHLDPKPQADLMGLGNAKTHLQRNWSIAPSFKEDFSMLLSPKSPIAFNQERLAKKQCFGSTAAISNDCTTTMIDRQSSKATDLEQPSGRSKKLLNINTQLTSVSSISVQDPEEADILKTGGFVSLKQAFESQARMVASSDPERHARGRPHRPTGARPQKSKVVSREQVQPEIREGRQRLPRALLELDGQSQAVHEPPLHPLLQILPPLDVHGSPLHQRQVQHRHQVGQLAAEALGHPRPVSHPLRPHIRRSLRQQSAAAQAAAKDQQQPPRSLASASSVSTTLRSKTWRKRSRAALSTESRKPSSSKQASSSSPATRKPSKAFGAKNTRSTCATPSKSLRKAPRSNQTLPGQPATASRVASTHGEKIVEKTLTLWVNPNIQAELRCIGSLIEILLEELPSFTSYKPIYQDIKNYFLSKGWPVQLEVSPQKNVVCTITIKPPK